MAAADVEATAESFAYEIDPDEVRRLQLALPYSRRGRGYRTFPGGSFAPRRIAMSPEEALAAYWGTYAPFLKVQCPHHSPILLKRQEDLMTGKWLLRLANFPVVKYSCSFLAIRSGVLSWQ